MMTAAPDLDPPALARFKDLCMDAVDVASMARFWSDGLGLTVRIGQGDTRLVGSGSEYTVWINAVTESKSVKHRLHLDVHGSNGTSEQQLVAAGARVVEKLPHWTVLEDPEGGEFCLFERAHPPTYRLSEICLDAADAHALAAWWARVLGTDAQSEDGDDWYWLTVPGAPFESLVLNPVPEAKVGKNRVHWDVTTADVPALMAAGAMLLRARDDEVGWHVLADPAGNEFCAFEA